MMVYQDILGKLAAAGWSSYRLQRERQIGNGTIQRIRDGKSVSTETIDKICELLGCQPNDIIRHVKD